MILHFVSADNVAYYQSPAFGKIINYLQNHPRRCKLKEVERKRSMVLANVPSVHDALDILTLIFNGKEADKA